MDRIELSCGQGVRVVWVDSASAKGWDYADKAGTNMIASLGLVVSSKPECLVLSSSLDECGGALDPLGIPWGAIKSIHIIQRDHVQSVIDETESEETALAA